MRRLLQLLIFSVTTIAVLAQVNTVKPGTIVEGKTVSVPSAIKNKFAAAVQVEVFVRLEDSDELVVYDTVLDKPDTADFMDNHPHIAVMRQGKILFDADMVSLAPAGPMSFLAMAVPTNAPSDAIAVFAFSLGVNGAGTFFVFLGQPHDSYKITATLTGTQAQLRFANGRYEFWSADGASTAESCTWCPKYFRKTTFTWRNGILRQVATNRTKQGYEPDVFSDRPFVLLK